METTNKMEMLLKCCSAKKLKLFKKQTSSMVFLPSIYALLRLRSGRFAEAIRERSGTL